MGLMSTILLHPYLVGSGAILLLLGVMLWRWASRHNLNDLVVDAAVHVAWNRGKLASAADTEIAKRLQDIKAETSNTQRAKSVAGHAARHFMAQVANIAGMLDMLAGAALIGLAFYLG